MVLGLGIMALAVGAFFSGEPASVTTQGRVVTIIVGLMGFLMFVNNLSGSASKGGAKAQPEAASAPPFDARPCPSCGKGVSSDHRFCPYCGTAVRGACPSCGKDVKSEFNVCPYCGTQLK